MVRNEQRWQRLTTLFHPPGDLNNNGHQQCLQQRRSKARGTNLSVRSGRDAKGNGERVHPLAPCARRVPWQSRQVNPSENQTHPAAPKKTESALHLRLPARAGNIISTGMGKHPPAKRLTIVCLPAKTMWSRSVPIHQQFVKHSLAQDSSLHCVGSTSTSGLLVRGKHEKARRWMMSSDVANFVR
jgi:hypothetical protein